MVAKTAEAEPATARKARAEAQLAATRNELAAQKAAIADLQPELADLDGQEATVKEDVSAAKHALQAAEHAVTEAEAAVMVDDSSEARQALEAAKAARTESAQALEAARAAYARAEAADVEARPAVLKRIAEAQAECDRLEKLCHAIQRLVTQAHEQAGWDELRRAEAEHTAHVRRIAELKAQLGEAEQELAAHQEAAWERFAAWPQMQASDAVAALDVPLFQRTQAILEAFVALGDALKVGAGDGNFSMYGVGTMDQLFSFRDHELDSVLMGSQGSYANTSWRFAGAKKLLEQVAAMERNSANGMHQERRTAQRAYRRREAQARQQGRAAS